MIGKCNTGIEPVASNISYDNTSSGLTAENVQTAIDELKLADDNLTQEVNSKAPAYTYGTEDLTAGTSPLATGTLHFVYE